MAKDTSTQGGGQKTSIGGMFGKLSIIEMHDNILLLW